MKIDIIGKPYAVAFVPEGHDGLKDGPDDNEPGSGRCDSDKQEIYVEKGQPLESEQDTVLHEVLHAVDHAFCIALTELQVRQTATGLLAVLKDNPEFLEYLARTS